MAPINQLYVDTTCLHKEIRELPLRIDSTTQLVIGIKEQLDNNPELHLEFSNRRKLYCFFSQDFSYFNLLTFNFAFYLVPGASARLLFEIAEEICQPIHVPRELAKFFSAIPEVGLRVTARHDPDLRLHFGCGELKDNEECSDRDWGSSVDVNIYFSLLKANRLLDLNLFNF